MVLKAGFFLSVGTAFGMYLAQEYDGMPNVKAFTTGLVSEAPGWLQTNRFWYLQATEVCCWTLQFYQAKSLEKDLRKDKDRSD